MSTEKYQWDRVNHKVIIYRDDQMELVFKRKSKKQKLRRKIVNMTCSKIDEGVLCLLRLVLLKNILSQLDSRLENYPDPLYLHLTFQKHPYKHLFLE